MSEMIGLDIGSHSVKLVGLKVTPDGPLLTHAGVKKIPHGEEKEDVYLISEIVKTLYREAGLKPGKVRLTISGSGASIRRVSIPSMPKAELREAVRWEIKDHLPFSIESARTDFHVLGEFVENGVKKLDLIAVACPNHLIDRTLSIAEGAGLKPTHLDVGPFALWNALLAFEELKKEEVIALIDLGAEKTGIHLFKDGILQFSREITPAGEDITRAIMDEIVSEEEPHPLYERAEKIKQEMGIPSEASNERINDKSINLSKISFLVRPVLERLAAEMGRSLEYYKNQFHVERIDRILLTGGGANLRDITSYVSGELRLPVEQFIPFREILIDSETIEPQSAQGLDQMSSMFTIATGVALPETRGIELLPAKPPYLSKARVVRLVPVTVSLITLLIFSLIIWDMNRQLSVITREHETKMAEVKKLEMLQAKLALLKDKENRIKQDLSLLPPSMIVNVAFREVLRTISHIMPDNVTLISLSVQDEVRTSKEEPQTNVRRKLHITGLAFGSDLHCLTALAKIIERLERSPLFKNAKLITAAENSLYNQPGTEFQIVCDIELGDRRRDERL